ncbi:protein kinase [Clostridium aestuarii]|uniref:non-specific serine/threonine protein kinase n=1 Tax=Clostridium aestuarii TaxID=338193 RepID=A0ABT4CXF9_9CLOT|nr:protein kinase [Clostridium aestuarii]MCY6483037.1 protein kinase [Clostridium aestuarii]
MININYILDGKYEIIKVMRKGYMGKVYLCKDIRLKRLCIINEVQKDFKKNIDILLTFNILQKLNYPSISKIFDMVYRENNIYIVQEYIEGQTLEKYVKEKVFLETKDICNITSNMCNIIDWLYNLNPSIIYRNLNPDNIIITSNGNVILSDFGVAKIDKAVDNNTIYMSSNCYVNSEQCNIQIAIQSIGMLMYFMATGKLTSIAFEPLIDVNYGNNIDSNLKKIIQKCFQIDIKNRYVSVKELNKEIIMVMLKKSNHKKSNKSQSKRNGIDLLAIIKKLCPMKYNK